jgi:hypothetical protein
VQNPVQLFVLRDKALSLDYGSKELKNHIFCKALLKAHRHRRSTANTSAVNLQHIWK